MPVFLSLDGATEESGPEAALGIQVGGIEHNNLVLDPHSVILAQAPPGGLLSLSIRNAKFDL